MWVMPRSCAYAAKLREVNSGPLSERIAFGYPWACAAWSSNVVKALNQPDFPKASYTFHHEAAFTMMSRVTRDPLFAARRGWLLSKLIKMALTARVHYLLKLLPPSMNPQIDCLITRKELA
jgi:hypothetical protein